jgi:hypothetical protein
MDFLGQRVSFLVFAILSLLIVFISLSYIEENLSLLLALFLAVVLIYQIYDMILDGIRSQIITVVLRSKFLYLYIYLNLYLNQLAMLLAAFFPNMATFYTKFFKGLFSSIAIISLNLGKTIYELDCLLNTQVLTEFVRFVPTRNRFLVSLRSSCYGRVYLTHMLLLG